eukprot:11159731-Lingulodinium_polyedra.AAC.1
MKVGWGIVLGSLLGLFWVGVRTGLSHAPSNPTAMVAALSCMMGTGRAALSRGPPRRRCQT